jgi:hypothetical protein
MHKERERLLRRSLVGAGFHKTNCLVTRLAMLLVKRYTACVMPSDRPDSIRIALESDLVVYNDLCVYR